MTSADVYSYIQPVVAPPSILLASLANGASYKQGQAVTAAYSCTAPAGTTVTTCAGPVATGALIDTTTLGSQLTHPLYRPSADRATAHALGHRRPNAAAPLDWGSATGRPARRPVAQKRH